MIKCVLLLLSTLSLGAQVIPLAGTWQFRLDAEKSGLQMNWQEQRFQGDGIFLPGSTDQAGYGLKTAGASRGWLSRPFLYEGPAWYQRSVVIPSRWSGKRTSLFLERPHWQTTVWIDGQAFGSQNSLVAPHVYDLGSVLTPGPHTITIRVDNTYLIDVGRNAHSVTEHTQTNWNGIVGRIELRATDPVWIDSVWIEPAIASRSAKVIATLRNTTGSPVRGELEATGAGVKVPVEISGSEQKVELTVAMGEAARLWDEYEPNMQSLTLRLAAGAFRDQWQGRFGLREIGTRDRQFILNGRPVFLRGTLECNIFPLTGYPPMTEEGWERLFRIARSYGLNHFRFHSWCPPEAAFAAADRAGFLLHVELPVWNRTLGKDPAVVEFMRAEGERIQRTYGNHPSFTMMCLGNELRGDLAMMDRLVEELQRRDRRRLYTFSADNERREPGPIADYYVSPQVKAGHLRVHGARFDKTNSATDFDFSDHIAPIPVPVVAHELGQWVTYPDYTEIAKYTGVLKPRNLEAFRARLEQRGMLDQAGDFQSASGKFSWLLYKEDIETAMRTPNFGGVQLLQLHDFPGQGEALIGLLDSFWDSKGILQPDEMRGFFSETVPLARFTKYVWTNDETFTAKLHLAHHGKADLKSAAIAWTLRNDAGETVASGRTQPAAVRCGQVASLGEARLALNTLKKAARLRLDARLEGASIANRWDIWVYPAAAAPASPGDVLIATAFDAAAKQKLDAGGKVLLLWPGNRPGRSTIPTTFLPVFWSLSWFPRQTGTLGILCDPAHPALASFPTDPHSNYQWYELTQGAPAFVLNDTPPEFRPLIQVIDDYHRNHKLGAVFETRVGRGKLLVSAFDLATDLDRRPVARQLRRSLVDYARGAAFNPRWELDSQVLDKLLSFAQGQ
jgi:beta-galactosidase